MNYLGNKYKLLSEIIPLFPKNINIFYDLFCGGLDVSLNVKANKVIANDKHEDLIWLYQEIKNYNSSELGEEILELDNKYFPMNEYEGKSIRTYSSTNKELYNKLFESKKEAYYSLRDKFNNGELQDFKILLLLMFNSFGLIEFRVVNRYVPFACGKGRTNSRIVKSLNTFSDRISKLEFKNEDFRFIKDNQFKENDFVYLDPPYLGTSQYKVKWSEDDEKELYELLDVLNDKGVKFALSNFEDGFNHTNDYLAKWCGKYNIHRIEDKHSKIQRFGDKERQEILVTNY